jgi:hypothetical protein
MVLCQAEAKPLRDTTFFRAAFTDFPRELLNARLTPGFQHFKKIHS